MTSIKLTRNEALDLLADKISKDLRTNNTNLHSSNITLQALQDAYVAFIKKALSFLTKAQKYQLAVDTEYSEGRISPFARNASAYLYKIDSNGMLGGEFYISPRLVVNGSVKVICPAGNCVLSISAHRVTKWPETKNWKQISLEYEKILATQKALQAIECNSSVTERRMAVIRYLASKSENINTLLEQLTTVELPDSL